MRAQPPSPLRRHRGYTLVEVLAVILVLGVLAALALPRLVNLGSDARIALLNQVNGALRTGAETAHQAWNLRANGNYGSVPLSLADGSVVYLWYGYPDAGNCCAPTGIEGMVDVSGLTVTQLNSTQTRFEATGAPQQANCSVTYTESSAIGASYQLQLVSTGC